jgi:hypothetical protein
MTTRDELGAADSGQLKGCGRERADRDQLDANRRATPTA